MRKSCSYNLNRRCFVKIINTVWQTHYTIPASATG